MHAKIKKAASRYGRNGEDTSPGTLLPIRTLYLWVDNAAKSRAIFLCQEFLRRIPVFLIRISCRPEFLTPRPHEGSSPGTLSGRSALTPKSHIAVSSFRPTHSLDLPAIGRSMPQAAGQSLLHRRIAVGKRRHQCPPERNPAGLS